MHMAEKKQAGPHLYALLIGIDCYLPLKPSDTPNPMNLRGCVGDINRTEEFLSTRLGLAADHILKLTATDVGARQRHELTLAQAVREYALDKAAAGPVIVPKPPGRKLFDFLTARGWLPALVGAAVLLATVGSLWVWWVRGWQGNDPQLGTAETIARLNKPPYSTESVLSVPLTGFLNRATGQGQKFAVPTTVDIVQLQLALPVTPYPSYQATLRVTDGAELFTLSDFSAQQTEAGRLLNLRLPARLLTPGDYTLSVSGRTMEGRAESVADYYFRVLR